MSFTSTTYIAYYKIPLGELIIGSWGNKLVLCDWKYRNMREAIDTRIKKHTQSAYVQVSEKEWPQHPILINTISQIEEYLVEKRQNFELPLHFAGSGFQLRVWEALMKIPFGKTVSYLELSKTLGDEKAIRAVASANGANAISIIVPCHRVIGSKGELTGYAGGLNAKQKLLQLENHSMYKNQQTRLF